MTAVTQMKCACEPCLCIISVSIEDVISNEGKYYCSKACAEGHKNTPGCGHTGCGC